MKQSEILELVRAGYSKEEIDAMSDETPANDNKAAEASGEKSLNVGQATSQSDDARPAESGQDPSTEDPNKELRSWLSNMRDDIAKQIKEVKEMQQALNVKVFDTEDDGDDGPKSAIDVYRRRYAEPEPEYDFNKRGE